MEASASQRIQIYMSTTEKRLEEEINDLKKKNELLMKDKIVLNGQIALLKS